MKKTETRKQSIIKFAAAVLLSALASTPALAETAYITGCVSNCASTTTCGTGIDMALNTSTGIPVYQDSYSAYTSAKASGSGVADKPTTPGSRYFSTSFSNTLPDGVNCVILSPALAVPGAVYRIDHTFSSTAGNVSTSIVVGVTNISGCTLSFSNTPVFQSSYGASPNSWSTLGYLTNNPGSSNPQLGLYFVSGIVSAGAEARMEFDCFRFVLAQPCLAVASPTVNGPLSTNVTQVTVNGVLSDATDVAVWQDSGSGMVKISSMLTTNPASTVLVPTTGLVAGASVGASQTVGGVESCPPIAGTLVGVGPNSSLRIALSIRGDATLAGPVWTTDTNSDLNIYFLGASTVLTGGAPADAMVVYPSNGWQTVTLERGPDSLNPTNPTVLWNNGASGTADLEGNFGALDAIAIACNGDPGYFDIYIDDISNGTNGVLENFDSAVPGTTFGFSQPSYSGTTSGNLLTAPNMSTISTNVAFSGNNSTHVQWQFVTAATNQWLRLVHSGNSDVANPQVDLTQPISFRTLDAAGRPVAGHLLSRPANHRPGWQHRRGDLDRHIPASVQNQPLCRHVVGCWRQQRPVHQRAWRQSAVLPPARQLNAGPGTIHSLERSRSGDVIGSVAVRRGPVAGPATALHGNRCLRLSGKHHRGEMGHAHSRHQPAGRRRLRRRRVFTFIRASRGGTTGVYNEYDPNNTTYGTNTLSQRYDDPYFVQNINLATSAGVFAGPYHFIRPDIIASTLNSGGIANTGADEANHMIQMAGPWMRPGYFPPVCDLETGQSQRTAAALTTFCTDFSTQIYSVTGIRPIMYINGNYADYVQSSIVPYFPDLWSARYATPVNPQTNNPSDSFAAIYGPWDDPPLPAQPWQFWQYSSSGTINAISGSMDLDVAQVESST